MMINLLNLSSFFFQHFLLDVFIIIIIITIIIIISNIFVFVSFFPVKKKIVEFKINFESY